MSKVTSITEFDAGVLKPGMHKQETHFTSTSQGLPIASTTSKIATMLDMTNRDVMSVVDAVMARRRNFGKYTLSRDDDKVVYVLTAFQVESFIRYIEPHFCDELIAQIILHGKILTRLQYRQVIARCPSKLIDTEGLDSVCGGIVDPVKVPCILI